VKVTKIVRFKTPRNPRNNRS